MKKIIYILGLISAACVLTGCSENDFNKMFGSSGDDSDFRSGIVGYANNGAIDLDDMTFIEVEQIHYGAAVIQNEDKFLFSHAVDYEFPSIIKSEDEWNLIQEKLNIEMEDIDFDEYIVFGDFQYDLWEKTKCTPVLIKKMAYSEETLYYGWELAEGQNFEAENKEDKLCGFNLVKIKRSDFPMEPRDIYGAAIKYEDEKDKDTIFIESGGYYLIF